MMFADELSKWPQARIESLINGATREDVEAAIRRPQRTLSDLAALLSPQAAAYLEPMAAQAQRITRQYFGRTIALYAPIYISNVCAANCAYCNFSARSGAGQKRLTLTADELRRECQYLRSQGFDNILLVSGEAPKIVTIDYMATAVRIAHEYFSSVSAEVYSMESDDYRCLHEAGLEGVTLYMETYDESQYARVHSAGIKRDYQGRLAAMDRAGVAGLRKLNIGVLLGLFDWRIDGFWTALHAAYLQKAYWRSAVAVSFPRLRHVPSAFAIPHPVTDSHLVQLILALRLFLPMAGFTLSTRESAELRNHLFPLGITQMSAGSSTRPGGYAEPAAAQALEQFEIEDDRSPHQMAQVIRQAGYDPVWKDFDRAFIESAVSRW